MRITSQRIVEYSERKNESDGELRMTAKHQQKKRMRNYLLSSSLTSFALFRIGSVSLASKNHLTMVEQSHIFFFTPDI